MSSHARFLKSSGHSSPPPPSQTPPTDAAATVDSDFVVILAALLCALICVLGLVAVARCAWLRRFAVGNSAPAAANKGLKKKVLKSLPKVAYSAEQHAGKVADECAICLSEFAGGEEIRVLPQCGHSFQVICIDTWLGSHSSCPSCRQILAAAPNRCQKCGGGLPETSCSGSSGAGASSLPPPLPLPSPPVRDSFLP